MFEELERITLEGRTLSEMSFGNERGGKVIQGYFMIILKTNNAGNCAIEFEIDTE